MHFFMAAVNRIIGEIIKVISISKMNESDFHFCPFSQWTIGNVNNTISSLKMRGSNEQINGSTVACRLIDVVQSAYLNKNAAGRGSLRMKSDDTLLLFVCRSFE
jgi:hypothetical protein